MSDDGVYRDMMGDVIRCVKVCEGKKQCESMIVDVFRRYDTMMYNTVRNVWFVKFEREKERKRRGSLVNARGGEVGGGERGDNNGNFNLVDSSGGSVRVEMKEGYKSDGGSEKSDNHQCMNCSTGQARIEEIIRKYALMEEDFGILSSKNQILISQNQMGMAENERLEKMNKELNDTVKFMDDQISKIISDGQKTRKTYLELIEEKRKENEELKLLVARYEDIEAKKRSENSSYKQLRPQTRILDGLENEQERSSMLLKRLLEENETLNNDLKVIKDSLNRSSQGIKNSSIFQSDANAQSGLHHPSSFEDISVSKIIAGGAVYQLNRLNSNDETLQHLKMMRSYVIQEIVTQKKEEDRDFLFPNLTRRIGVDTISPNQKGNEEIHEGYTTTPKESKKEIQNTSNKKQLSKKTKSKNKSNQPNTKIEDKPYYRCTLI